MSILKSMMHRTQTAGFRQESSVNHGKNMSHMQLHGKSDKIFSINNKIIWAIKIYKDAPIAFSSMFVKILINFYPSAVARERFQNYIT